MTVTPARYRASAIRQTIRQQGRSVTWVAEQLPFSRQYTSDVVNGRRAVNEETAKMISALLGIPFFLGWDLQSCNQTFHVCDLDNGEEAA